jgi:hypothetical protein
MIETSLDTETMLFSATHVERRTKRHRASPWDRQSLLHTPGAHSTNKNPPACRITWRDHRGPTQICSAMASQPADDFEANEEACSKLGCRAACPLISIDLLLCFG